MNRCCEVHQRGVSDAGTAMRGLGLALLVMCCSCEVRDHVEALVITQPLFPLTRGGTRRNRAREDSCRELAHSLSRRASFVMRATLQGAANCRRFHLPGRRFHLPDVAFR